MSRKRFWWSRLWLGIGLVGVLVLGLMACRAPTPAAPAPTPVVRETSATPVATPVPKLEKVRVAVPTELNTDYFALELAMAKGFFKQEGLDVQSPPIILSGMISVAALDKKDIDFNGSASSSMRYALEGGKVRAVIFTYDKQTFHIVSTPEIQSMADLKGNVLSVGRTGSSNYWAAVLALERYGLVPDKDTTVLSIVDEAARISAVLAGKVTAGVFGPDQAATMIKKGARGLLYVGDFMAAPSAGFAVNEDKLKTNPDQVRKFIRAYLKTLMYARDNKDEVTEFMMKTYQLDRDIARQTLDYYLGAVNLKDLGAASDEGLKTFINTEVPRERRATATFDKIVDFTLLKEVQKELKLR